MQQHEFNLFAKKIKQEGKLTTKQALDKFVKAMMQGQKLKIVKKKTVRNYENGIKKQSDGSERCMTKAAWQRRREEVWERDGHRCRGTAMTAVCCGQPLQLHQAHIHHLRKRSVGRNDAQSNLITLCETCHTKIHDEFKKRGAGQ